MATAMAMGGGMTTAICGRRSWVLGGDAALAPYATGKGEMNGGQKRRRG